MNDKTYTLELTDQEMVDVLIGIERLIDLDQGKFEKPEWKKRLKKLWNKITDVYEERT